MSNLSIQCPECERGSIITTAEDEEFLYLCEDCGWAKVARFPFRIGVWDVRLQQALAPIDVLQSLLSDKDVVKFIRPRLRGVSHLSQPIPNFDLGDDYYRGEIDIANSVYLSQMVVLAATYSELMIKDFYKCLFLEQPRRMNSVMSLDGKNRATIDLNELIEASSKEEILERLAERAAKKSAGRKVDEIVSKLVKDCELNLSHPIIEDLKLLNERRNRIVHEGELSEIDIDQVLNIYGQLMYLLYVLSEATNKYDLPSIDETGFLHNFRKRLNNE